MDQEAAAAAVEADADALSLPETVKESFSLPSQGTKRFPDHLGDHRGK